MAGGLCHADDRHRGKLAQGEQAGIAETGDDHRVSALALARVDVEHRVTGNGGRGPRGDVARAETAGRRHNLGFRASYAAGNACAELGQMRAGVRVDEEESHVSAVPMLWPIVWLASWRAQPRRPEAYPRR
jgi:hypothetical protein